MRKIIDIVDTRADKKPITKIDLKEIEFFGMIGLEWQEIADYYKIRPETISRLQKKYVGMNQVFRAGRFKDKVRKTKQMSDLCDKGDFQALKWYLSVIHNLNETTKMQHTIINAEKAKEEILQIFEQPKS